MIHAAMADGGNVDEPGLQRAAQDRARPKTPTRSKDPGEDGPWIFDRWPARREIAWACRDPAELSEVIEASSLPDANTRTAVEKLCEWGVLREVRQRRHPRRLVLEDAWRQPLDQARRRAASGRFVNGQRLFLITTETVVFGARVIADKQADGRLLWAATIDDSHYGLLIALDPSVDGDDARRLLSEFVLAGAVCHPLRLDAVEPFDALSGLGARLLPGAFDAST